MIILNNQPSYQTMHDPTKQRMYMKIYLGLVFQISLCLPIFAQALLKKRMPTVIHARFRFARKRKIQ